MQEWDRLEPQRRICPISAELRQLLSHADIGDRTENSKDAEEPQDNCNDNDGIQDRFNGTRHRDKSVDEPENNTYHDQDYYYLN
jgi:hypothetical protein